MGMTGRRFSVIAFATFLCLTGLLSSAASSAALAAGGGTSGAARACGPLPEFNKAVANEIMAGRLTITPLPPSPSTRTRTGMSTGSSTRSTTPPGARTSSPAAGSRSGLRVTWRAARERSPIRPGRSPSRDAGCGRAASRPGPADAGLHLARRSPARRGSTTRSRRRVELLRRALDGRLEPRPPAGHQAAHIGCGYPPGAFGGDALRWRQTAVAQLTDAFKPNPLGPSIDAQGAVNEQATLYENFVYGLWRQRAARARRVRLPAARLDHGADRARCPPSSPTPPSPTATSCRSATPTSSGPATSPGAPPSSRSTRRPGTCSAGQRGRRRRRSTRSASGRGGRSTATTTTWA